MSPDDQGTWWQAQALALAAEAQRLERRQGTALIIVSAVFVAVSMLCMFIGTLRLIGLVCLVFFGACLFAGILMRRGPNSRTTFVLTLWVALLMGLGMGLLFIFTLLSALTYGASGNQIVVLVVAAIGFLFLGVGAVVALVKAGRTGRKARDQWQNRRPHVPTGR
ncbi:hypothetical protein [Brevibacterium sp. UCMA 11754]|uniref:hypothetical protein n=1 Tax=Brevibacterium sp. UCMA 11754 TaxID=2749198 RepID=UPI001F33D9A3|nr:hypothetical protein [Brevibacterium sp. UCMA 11754]MCF2573064.1 hypothetical protein [Brevibacterium sp. UCMA 11754]